jgi:hypothetical protein
MTRLALTLAALLVAQVASAHEFRHVSSGMLLGIYTTPAQGGMQVVGLIPGYSAEGRLFRGDVLLRVAVSEHEVYRVRSLYELENAKTAIGPHREAAVELWRPQVGLIYAWVEFTPIYGPAAAAGVPTAAAPAASAARSYSAQFRLESEKPGARAMFQPSHGQHPVLPNRSPLPHRQPHQVDRALNLIQDASRFFSR